MLWIKHTRHGTGSHFVTQRPSDPGIQRPGDPVDPVTLFYRPNELQISKKCSQAKECLIIIGKSKSVKVHCMDWHPVISVQQQTPEMTFVISAFQMYVLHFGHFFRNPEKTRVSLSHRVKMMTRWPGRERWPIDPVTQWPSSMSETHIYLYPFRRPKLNMPIHGIACQDFAAINSAYSLGLLHANTRCSRRKRWLWGLRSRPEMLIIC